MTFAQAFFMRRLWSESMNHHPNKKSSAEDDRVIRLAEVKKIAGVSSMSLWRWEQSGEFPRRFPIGGNSIGWSYAEIMDWLKSRKSERISD